MKVFGELEKAVLEKLASDPASSGLYRGRIWLNTSSDEVKIRHENHVASLTPTGVVMDFAGSSAPDGWLLCDGSTLDSVTNTKYAKLYSVIGTTFGGTGASDFKVPDNRGRVTVGVGSGSGLTTRALGDSGGAEDKDLSHTHTINHNHKWHTRGADYSSTTPYTYDSSGNATLITGGAATSNTADAIETVAAIASEAFNKDGYTDNDNTTSSSEPSSNKDVMNPFLALNKIIKY